MVSDTPEPGTYALILYSPAARLIRVGRLGRMHLRRGFYVYIGSAFGPGGLRGRLGHHRNITSRPHWHVDYLRARTRLVGISYSLDTARHEHLWAKAVTMIPGVSVPLAGFGSSDCGCLSHLFLFEKRPSSMRLRRALRMLGPTRAAISELP